MPASGGIDFGGDLVGLEGEENVAGIDGSPSFLCQVERMPEVMDSPTVGTLTSTFIRKDGSG